MKTEAIKNHLLSGKRLTSLDAVRLFGTIKLTTRISEMRRDGLKINDEWLVNKKTKSRYKSYWIKK